MDKNFLFAYKTSKNPFFFHFQEKEKVTLVSVNIFFEVLELILVKMSMRFICVTVEIQLNKLEAFLLFSQMRFRSTLTAILLN